MLNHVFQREDVILNAVKGPGRVPVFFQHGLCGSAAQTAEVFPVEDRFALRTLECRGHGQSQSGDHKSFSINDFARDVAAFVEAEKSAPIVIGGISMGAAIALHLAVHKPELVKTLVIARPAWVCNALPENIRPNLEVGELLRNFAPDEAKAKFLAGKTARTLAEVAPDNLASLTSFFSRQSIDTTSALLRGIAGSDPAVTPEQVRAIRVPTLIIATERDYIHPMAHAVALRDMIPQSRLVTITPKGVDKPRHVAEFRAQLLQFLEVHA
jgi:pimeloyl-ACP methyl ester carboxylesterase